MIVEDLPRTRTRARTPASTGARRSAASALPAAATTRRTASARRGSAAPAAATAGAASARRTASARGSAAAGSAGAATALAHHPLDERAAAGPTRRPARPDLRIVRDGRLSRRARRRRARLVAIVAAVLATALLFGVVAFHGMLIAGQMRLDRLDAEVTEEQARYQRNRLKVAELESPERIVAVAQERLGMVPPDAVTYLAPTAAAADEVRSAAAPAARGRRRDARVWVVGPQHVGEREAVPRQHPVTATRPPGARRPGEPARPSRPGPPAPGPARPRCAVPRRPARRGPSSTAVAAPRPPAPRTPAGHPGPSKRRAVTMLVVFAVAFGLVAARLAQLQLLAPDHYAGVSMAQRMRTVTLPADRGSIFDRNGNELAMSVRQHAVWANPQLVADAGAAAVALAPVLGVDERTLLERLLQPGQFAYLARQVDDETADKVETLDLDGIALLDEPRRFQPAGELASSVLGSVGVENLGLSGLELQYEDLLKGEPGELVFERGIDGRTIAVGEHRLVPAERGSDLVLTIDRSLQYEVERSLAAAVEQHDAKGGTAVVMDPRTGEVLALANLRPDGEGKAVPTRNNMALTDVFEPGSINKVITLAGAIEDGLVEPDTMFQVPDHLRVSTHTYHDSEDHPVKSWTVADILANSSNVGTITIAQQLGKERIDHYLRAFGFGKSTGLGFPGETRGIIKDLDDWSGPDMGSVPIGSGVAVTAVQMLAAYNVVANGGVYVQPRLVRATVDAAGHEHAAEASESHRVISERTAAQMRGMMTKVVTEGTGTRAQIEGYTVAGKTGTAHKPSPNGGYELGAYMSSFAGFVPAEDPRLSAIIVLDDPTPFYGGIVAAPVFSQAVGYGLRVFRIPPAAPNEVLPDAPVTEVVDATLPEQ